MGWEAGVTVVVLVVTFTALAKEWLPPPATFISAVVALLVSGVITPEEAFAGFANPAPITVAALYVLARAVEKTGALQPLVAATLGRGSSRRGSLLRLVVPTAAASAFLNNTPIVAMLVPQVSAWAERRGRQSPSRYLMPLSFAAILGGVATAIGTSTNLVISGLLEASGEPPLGMFEISAVGLPVALIGLALIVLLGPALIPERRSVGAELDEEFREFVLNMLVTPGGPLDGKTVEEGGLRQLQGVFLVEVDRRGEIIPVTPSTVLHGDDRLVFVGKADLVVDLQGMRGLVSTEHQHTGGLDTARHTFFEAVVGKVSPLVGRTLKEVSFRAEYQAAVVAIHRAGGRVKAKLGQVKLRSETRS